MKSRQMIEDFNTKLRKGKPTEEERKVMKNQLSYQMNY